MVTVCPCFSYPQGWLVKSLSLVSPGVEWSSFPREVLCCPIWSTCWFSPSPFLWSQVGHRTQSKTACMSLAAKVTSSCCSGFVAAKLCHTTWIVGNCQSYMTEATFWASNLYVKLGVWISGVHFACWHFSWNVIIVFCCCCYHCFCS